MMDALNMLEHYKQHGERVDEVLFQTVAAELTKLRAVLEQKNREYDACTNEASNYHGALTLITKRDVADQLMFSNQQMNALAEHALSLTKGGGVNV